jgi:hypothetical protein
MRSYGIIVAGALCLAGGAEAQTTLIDTDVSVPSYMQTADTFTLATASNLFIEGAAPSNAQIEGTGLLIQNGNVIDTFALTNGSGNVLFNQFTLAAGTYTFAYDFSNSTPVTGGSVYLNATVSAVTAPEMDPTTAMAGLTLLGGGLATMRGRRFKSTRA